MKKKDVAEQPGVNGVKKLGGITGKGFLPGRSGNPRGPRPKAERAAELFREMAAQGCDIKAFQGMTWERAMIKATMYQVLKGNAAAIREVFGRLYGPIPTRIEIPDPERPSDLTDAELMAILMTGVGAN